MLDSLPSSARTTLLASATPKAFGPGEVIFLAGTAAHTLYVILEGQVRVVRERSGRPVLIHDERPGGALGEVPIFEGVSYPATAIAAERTTVLAIPREVVIAAIRQHPDFALALLARLARRVRVLVDRLDANSTRSTLARLADLVLHRAHSSTTPTFTLGATQQQVAEEIGTVREIVVRGLRALRDQGAIESRGGGRYAVRDVGVLEGLVKGRTTLERIGRIKRKPPDLHSDRGRDL